MAAKPPHDAAAPTATSHRIASLSRESDNSPSSRSSTSSWSVSRLEDLQGTGNHSVVTIKDKF